MTEEIVAAGDTDLIYHHKRPFVKGRQDEAHDVIIVNPQQDSPVAAVMFQKVNSTFPGTGDQHPLLMLFIPRDGELEIDTTDQYQIKNTPEDANRASEGTILQYLIDKGISYRKLPRMSEYSTEALNFLRNKAGIKEDPLRIDVFSGDPRKHETRVTQGENFMGPWCHIEASDGERLFRMLKEFENDGILPDYIVDQIVKNVVGIDMNTITDRTDPGDRVVGEGTEGTVVTASQEIGI